jgi:hypothetical protein
MTKISSRRNDALMVDNNRSRDTRAAFQSDASFDYNPDKSLVKPAQTILTKQRSRTQQRGKIVNYSVRFNINFCKESKCWSYLCKSKRFKNPEANV